MSRRIRWPPRSSRGQSLAIFLLFAAIWAAGTFLVTGVPLIWGLASGLALGAPVAYMWYRDTADSGEKQRVGEIAKAMRSRRAVVAAAILLGSGVVFSFSGTLWIRILAGIAMFVSLAFFRKYVYRKE